MVYPRIVYTDLDDLTYKAIDGLPALADHLGRLEENCRGNREAEGVGGLQVDDELEAHRSLHAIGRRLMHSKNPPRAGEGLADPWELRWTRLSAERQARAP